MSNVSNARIKIGFLFCDARTRAPARLRCIRGRMCNRAASATIRSRARCRRRRGWRHHRGRLEAAQWFSGLLISPHTRAAAGTRGKCTNGFMRVVRRGSAITRCFNHGVNTRCYASPALFTSLAQFVAMIVKRRCTYGASQPRYFLTQMFLPTIRNGRPSRGEYVEPGWSLVSTLPSEVLRVKSSMSWQFFFFALSRRKTGSNISR